MVDQHGISYKKTESRGIIMLVHTLQCVDIHPSKYGEILTVIARLQELPRSRITFRYSILNPSDVLLAKGFVTLAFVDSTRGVPVRAPLFLTEVLEKYLNL